MPTCKRLSTGTNLDPSTAKLALLVTSVNRVPGPYPHLGFAIALRRYLGNLTEVVVAAGVPKSALLTHYGGTLIPKGADPVAPTMKYVGGELPGIGLGVSLYDTLLDLVPSFVAGPVRYRQQRYKKVQCTGRNSAHCYHELSIL